MYTENNVVLTFNGTNNFISNSAESGGAIGTYFDVLLTFNGTNSFINNSAESGGAIDTYESVTFTFNGTNSFINNSASKGGAVDAYQNSVLMIQWNQQLHQQLSKQKQWWCNPCSNQNNIEFCWC